MTADPNEPTRPPPVSPNSDSITPAGPHRVYQCLLIASFLPLCWLGMLVIHELGHVASAVVTGGRVSRVVLHPLQLSRTDLAHNPHPGVVAWSGPVIGVLLPLTALALFHGFHLPGRYLVRFFAGFCLIANGAYLGAGAWSGAGDAGDLLRTGTPCGILVAFGLLTVPAGLWLWNGQGKHFGLGAGAQRVEPTAAIVSLALLLFTATLLAWLG